MRRHGTTPSGSFFRYIVIFDYPNIWDNATNGIKMNQNGAKLKQNKNRETLPEKPLAPYQNSKPFAR